MGLEQRLMHCLDVNLRDREEVIEEYGNEIDFMRDYSYKNDMKNELATALNLFKKRGDIEPSDFDGMKLLHTRDALQAYEQKHGIKSLLFDIGIPNEKFKALMPKLDGKEWYGGMYFDSPIFNGFHHSHLLFSKFGFGMQQETWGFEHESLHCDKRIYTAGYYARFMPDKYDADYPDSRWRAMAELYLAEEIFGYMAIGFQPEQVEESITQNYIEVTINLFLSTFTGLNDEQKAEKGKKFEQIFMPVKGNIGKVVKYAYSLKENLPFNLLTPLYFSIGPTSEDIKAGNFCSPFADISFWEKCISGKRIIQWDIRNRLRKKGYCLENSCF